MIMKRIFKHTVSLLLTLAMVLAFIPVTQVQAASLKQGSSGAEVRYLQENLAGLGYLVGTPDGSYGPKTAEAVRQFQKDYGLTVDGSAGNATQTAINNAVVRLQAELQKFGCVPGSADGHFGSKTQKALKEFQRTRGLEVTGFADEKTWSKINSESGGMRAGTTIPRGSSSTQVKYLQQALIGMGYLTGSADSKYGPNTAEAVRKYQSAYGLRADGSAGPNTMTSLRNTISTLQSDLSRKGLYSSTIDGVYGNGTKSAVKAYQQNVRVSATGVAGPKTMEKLYGYILGGSDGGETESYKVQVTPLYQTGDTSKFWYDSKKRIWKTVETSGCAGVCIAMALNALENTNKHTGKSAMEWFVESGDYYGQGTEHDGLLNYPKERGLKATYCENASSLVEHLKKDRLAMVLLRDRTGKETFVSSSSSGHYVLVSGYRLKDGVKQVYVNNPLRNRQNGWVDLDILMDNTSFRADFDPIVVIYK